MKNIENNSVVGVAGLKSSHDSFTSLCKLAARNEFTGHEPVDTKTKHYLDINDGGFKQEKLLAYFQTENPDGTKSLMSGWTFGDKIGGGLKRGELTAFSAFPLSVDNFPKTNFSLHMAVEMLRRNPGMLISFEETPMQRLMADLEGYPRK